MRDKEKLRKKQEMILKILEEEKKAAEFHAQPMPVFEDGLRGVPEKKPPTPTRVQPFNLRSNQRGEKIREQFQRTLAEEEKQDKERRTFKATSDDVVHKQPFIPEKSKKPCTDISGFILTTEVRSEARNEFDLHQKQRTDELSAAKRELEARQEAEETAAVAKIRREAVHKANPVPHYKPVEIKPSSCPPTVPLSPKFATKFRL
ncbi:Protein tpx2 [Halocaridina rubra]|uniref:Protein tpx2 n=1 Tax=Halocaridina rubra TaxID=373956 RepID=A0AAN8XFG1_HALRR